MARIPVSTPRCFEASDCGRLGRQAAGHPWSALRVGKSCRKDCPTASVLPKPKQQLCIQSGTRAHYLNYLHRRWARRGKEAQAIGLASQSDRQKSDGQTGDLRIFLARRTRVARVLISTPRMVQKLLIVGDSAVRLLVTLGVRSAW